MEQLTIDFTKPLVHHENNLDSQTNFNNNVEHFSNQCKKVFKALVRGERLTTKKALLEYGIGDLRRRIKDLKDTWDVPIEDEFAKDENDNQTRYKEYFLPEKYHTVDGNSN